MAVREVMDQQEVHIIHESFTIDIRCKITWAILTKGWSFFNRVLVNNHFTQVESFLWTTSLIRQTADNVRYTKEIVHPSYPTEWMVGTGKQGSLLPVVHKGQFCIPTNAAGGGGDLSGTTHQGWHARTPWGTSLQSGHSMDAQLQWEKTGHAMKCKPRSTGAHTSQPLCRRRSSISRLRSRKR